MLLYLFDLFSALPSLFSLDPAVTAHFIFSQVAFHEA